MATPEEPKALPEMQRQTSPFVVPVFKRQVSPGQPLPLANSDPYPEDFFSKRGIDLPSHLSTKRGRWKTLLIVVISSAFASGPIASWPTLEPILISAGVWEGPDQQVKLTRVYSLATGIAMIGQVFAGIVYDAVGPRATAAGSAFLIVACLAGMAFAIQFQSLNFLLWICYPAATALGYCNSMGGYAWLYLLPDSQNTVASLTGAIQILSDSFVLIAVLFHDKLGLPLPFYFGLSSILSLVAGVVCLMLIPDHAISQQVAFAVSSPYVDAESGSYGAADSAVKREMASSFWDVVKRSATSLRNCCICLVYYCPGASALFILGYEVATYMFGVYPNIISFPLWKALLGNATATTLVNLSGGMNACNGAVWLILFGWIVDYVGFETSIALVNIPIILNFVCLCTPIFSVQVIGIVLFAFQSNTWYVLVPRWCVSYVPPELYGSAFGIGTALLGALQMICTPFVTLLSSVINKQVTKHPPPAMKYQTTCGIWASLSVITSLAYLLFLQYYPMPAPGSTTMADVMNCTKGANKDAEADHFAKKILSKQELPADKQFAQKSSTPTCAPCDCLRPQLGSKSS